MDITERVRALAKEQGHSLTSLEQELGLGNGTISRWSKSSPTSEKLNRIARYFDVSVDYLLGNTTNRQSHKIPVSPEHLQKLSELPALYFHLFQGIEGLDLSERDVEFILDVAQKYKITKQEGAPGDAE